MDAIEVMKTRRSVRSYRPDPVAKKIIEDLVDCGRLAATGRGIQPWEFVVVTDAGTRAKLAALATSGKFIEQAPVCIAVFCEDTTYFLEDGAAATQNILLAARAHGLGSCWVAGDKKDHAEPVRELLRVPESHRLVSLIAVGYATEPPPEREKRTLEDVIHWEHWGR